MKTTGLCFVVFENLETEKDSENFQKTITRGSLKSKNVLLDYLISGALILAFILVKAPLLGFYHTLKVPLGFLQPFIIVLQSTFDCILCP
jgi:hypothetical protein